MSKKKGKNINSEEIKKKSLNSLNEMRLKALYNYSINNSLNNTITIPIYHLFEIILYEEKEKNYKVDFQKILALFSILKFGISSDILDYFFKNEEIKFITDKPNYLISIEKNEEEIIYYLDSSYIDIIIDIFNQKYSRDLSKYLKLVFQKYLLIFKYLIYYSNFPFDIISMQFNQEIHKYFMESNDEYKKKEEEKPKIFFDDVLYSNNILYILENKVLKELKESKINVNDYLCQISIYLPIILHFKKSYIYRNIILNYFFDKKYNNFKFDNKIEIQILNNWIRISDKKEGNNKYILEEKKIQINDEENKIKLIEEDNSKNKKNDKKNILLEFYLYTIYEYIHKNKKDELYNVFEKCIKIIKKDDNLSLSRLYLLYGTYTDNNDYLKCAEQFAQKLNEENNKKNLYMLLSSKIKLIEWKLKNNIFDTFYKEFNDNKKIKNENIENDISLKNSDIEIKLSNLLNLEKKLFNNYVKNMLFFFISEPFYIEIENNINNKKKCIALKTESNNSFFLKFKLSTTLPYLQFEFQKIDKELDNLKKCLQYPIKFLYIGSYYFNDNGNICYVDDNYIGHFIDNKKIKEIIDKSKCKESCDIVILGVLNSGKKTYKYEKSDKNDKNGNNEKSEDNLFEIFKSNNFRHIMYINKIDSINKYLSNSPILYFYFQKIFLYL